MGDVEGIADKDGTVRCMYDYDVWGKLTDMTGDKLNQLEGYVKRDLTALKYKVQSITQTTPSYSLSRHALAFKLRTNPWDYHFMRLQKGEGKWSFKAGWKGPAFWINGKTPNQVTWTEYKCYYSRPVWENVGVAYNSALWYITYK